LYNSSYAYSYFYNYPTDCGSNNDYYFETLSCLVPTATPTSAPSNPTLVPTSSPTDPTFVPTFAPTLPLQYLIINVTDYYDPCNNDPYQTEVYKLNYCFNQENTGYSYLYYIIDYGYEYGFYQRSFYSPNCEGYSYDFFFTYVYTSCSNAYYSGYVASLVSDMNLYSPIALYTYPDSENCGNNIWSYAVFYPTDCVDYSQNYYFLTATCSGNTLDLTEGYGSCDGIYGSYSYVSYYSTTCGSNDYSFTVIDCDAPTPAPTPTPAYVALVISLSDPYYPCSDPYQSNHYVLNTCSNQEAYGVSFIYVKVDYGSSVTLYERVFYNLNCEGSYYEYYVSSAYKSCSNAYYGAVASVVYEPPSSELTK